MIKKGTIVVRTKKMITGTRPEQKLNALVQAIKDDGSWVYYDDSSSIPSNSFRLATGKEIFLYNNGVRNLDDKHISPNDYGLPIREGDAIIVLYTPPEDDVLLIL